MNYAEIKWEALNIYLNPDNDIADVDAYLDHMVSMGRITSHEARCIMEAVYCYDE